MRHLLEVDNRRTVYELRKARERGHILEGLAIALANVDPVIELIRQSPSAAEAKEKLINSSWVPGNVIAMLERAGADSCRPDDLEAEFGLQEDNGEYRLSPAQAQAILELRLHRLTGLEHEKLLNEYKDILEKVAELAGILADAEKLLQVIREELEAIREQYGEERRTEIISSHLDLTMEDLINEEDMVVTISRSGYAKSQPLSDYRAQHRGGRGKSATSVKDEDVVEHLLVASTHDTILLFSNKGKVYWLKVYELPQAGRGSRGRPMVNLLPLEDGEQISTILPVREYPDDHFVFMATANGTVKKTALSQFSRPRSSGLIALDIEEGDRLIGAAITNGENHVMLLSSAGKMIRFEESKVRAMGRTARGVRGMRLPEGAHVISLIIPQTNVVDEEESAENDNSEQIYIMTASENGYGKRTRLEAFPVYGRGGQGVIAMQTSERNGQLVSAMQVSDLDEMMLITDKGTLVRTRVAEVSVSGRNTQGVTLIRLGADENLVTAVRVDEPTEIEEELEDGAVVDGAVVDGTVVAKGDKPEIEGEVSDTDTDSSSDTDKADPTAE
jgi:DNA gyrase subunit A